jgi:hypothetical protein
LKNKLVNIKEVKNPTNKPIDPIYFKKMIDKIIPNTPCTIDKIVGNLLYLSADKKTTDT